MTSPFPYPGDLKIADVSDFSPIHAKVDVVVMFSESGRKHACTLLFTIMFWECLNACLYFFPSYLRLNVRLFLSIICLDALSRPMKPRRSRYLVVVVLKSEGADR